MKVLLDALGAPASSGGMRLYVDGVVRGWIEAHPEDELTILGGAWAREDFAKLPSVRVIVWPNDFVGTRMLGQLVVSAVAMLATRSDAVISLSTLVSPLIPRAKRVCVVHDWRHVKNPEQFGRAQLAYRRLWKHSVRTAGAVVSISTKTQAETLEIVPGANGVVVENGRDYVRFWPERPGLITRGATKRITTFGHFANKRPDLVIDALALLAHSSTPDVQLTVLGARGEFQDTLRARARELGVVENCSFPGFVDQDEYETIIRSSDLVVLASTDEGFGLPVAEANFLGIPALVTSDSGLAEIHTEGIIVAEPNATSVAEKMLDALSGRVPRANLQSTSTWAGTAAGLRDAVLLAARR